MPFGPHSAPTTVAEGFAIAHSLYESERLAEAEVMCRRILALTPQHGDAWHLMGQIAFRVGQPALAGKCLEQAIAIHPEVAVYYNSLSVVWHAQHRREEALAAARKAVALGAHSWTAHFNLGNALLDARALSAAAASFREALSLNPNFADAHNNLGVTLLGLDQPIEAAAHFRAASQLDPRPAGALSNLATALRDVGDMANSIAAFRQALSLRPDDAAIRSSLIYSLQYLPEEDAAAMTEEMQQWNLRHAAPHRASRLAHRNPREPDRRLKVGYVSPEFVHSAIAFFLLPLLEAHDRHAVEVTCYATAGVSDEVTAEFRKATDRWREVENLSDAELAEQIRRDEIDVLVDLSLHSATNRLRTFATKPAPVQISWLAYPGSSGVETMDYRLTDRHLEPMPQATSASTEEPIRLPDSWCCYRPIGDFPDVGELPAFSNQYVTFGALNRFAKVHEATLRRWGRLLQAVANSRLVILCPEGTPREETSALFQSMGLAADRIGFVGRTSFLGFLRLFHRIDIGLDTDPINGMTTTCHALWMGVPVVTLSGASAVSRASLSLVSTLGWPHLSADREDEYLQIAQDLARDLPRLAALRATLRERMRASPLMDAPRFARHVEAAYRSAWQRWCAGEDGTRTIQGLEGGSAL